MIGGEHTISVGVVGAYREKIPDLKILILDAHADLREKYQGSKYSHACVTRRIVEMGFEVYVMGVRSISKEEVEFVEKEKKVLSLFELQISLRYYLLIDGSAGWGLFLFLSTGKRLYHQPGG